MATRTTQRTTLPTPPVTIANVASALHYHSNAYRNGDGTCQTWRANGAVQTWKTRPTHFRAPVKYGMYAYGNITHENGHMFHLAADCPYHD